MAPDTIERSPTRTRRIPSLLRQQCYVDGQWIDADDGGSMPVVDPATGVPVGTAPVMHAAETRRAIDAANRALARVAREDREGALGDPAQMARPDARERRRPRADPHHRAGQAARRSEGRGRRSAPRTSSGSPRKRSASTATSSRRSRNDRRLVVVKEPVGVCAAITPWNFPSLDDHAQGLAGARRRLHRRHQAGGGDAVFRVRARRARAARGLSARRAQRHHRRRAVDRRRDVRESDRAQALVHRLDRGRPAADEAGRADDQEDLARARRQRAVHRVRRRRPRRGGRRRDHLEVPQRGPDLRLREPLLRARQGLRRVRRASSPRGSAR